MDSQKLFSVIALYRRKLEAMSIGKSSFPHDELLPSFPDRSALEHCHLMLDDLERFVKEGRLEKAFRWLGFLQGTFWALRLYSIEEMKDHNRPAE